MDARVSWSRSERADWALFQSSTRAVMSVMIMVFMLGGYPESVDCVVNFLGGGCAASV